MSHIGRISVLLPNERSLCEFNFHLKTIFIFKTKYIDYKALSNYHCISNVKCIHSLKEIFIEDLLHISLCIICHGLQLGT